MDATSPVVIVGAGMAAYALARELRKRDRATPLTLVTCDGGGAYAKPLLSNAFALGKDAAGLVSAGAGAMGASLDAQVLARTYVTGIDRAARRLRTGRGSIPYGRLVLALGADPVRLPLQGTAAGEVLSVNHLDDYAILRAKLERAGPGARVLIIGAGLAGCEFADDLVTGGYRVTLVDPVARPLARLAAPALSRALLRAWEDRPITLKLGTAVQALDHDGGALRVRLADGSAVQADVVLSAVGTRPRTALARQAGLATGRGIAVDAFGRSSDHSIFALGDCAEYHLGGRPGVRAFVAPMLAAARAIAGTLSGTPSVIAPAEDAIVVKTPSCRMALYPPPPGLLGEWRYEIRAAQVTARFIDDDGVVRGFGLAPHTPALRQAMLAELGRVRSGRLAIPLELAMC